MARQRTNEHSSTRRMRIGGRLLLLLAVPLVGLLAVTGYGVVSGVQQSRDASGLQQRTDLALTAYSLIDQLQIERSSLVDGEPTSEETKAAVQAGVDSITRQAAEVGGEIEREAARSLVRVDAAQRVDAIGLGARAAMASHSAAIDRLLILATMSIDPGGALDGAPAETANNLARAQAASAEERDLVVVVSSEAELSAATFQELTSLASAQRSYATLAASTAEPAMAVQIERVGHGIDAADAVRRDVFSDPGVRDYSTWISGLETRTADLQRLQHQAGDLAVAAVDDLATSARVLLVLAALAAIATVLITVLLLRRAARSISRPLEELAAQAEDVARTRLPAAVKAQQLDPSEGMHLPALRATGAAEVYEVAAAFNDVQDTALRLASEQAALRVNQSEALTNLGRRNQTLLARQLDFISSLETKETDPAFLEHLFKLDHLASRMRRNAESLLILAGSETPRRRRAPAQVSEVIRAAMSEVEEFERVRIGHLRDATLTGPVVIDLIHLLAEIIENALGFSPPDTTVEIDGRSLGQGGYQFAVIDHGVGMSDVELVAANQRLAGLDELEGMPTRYLGQYVVAKLAAKTGVMVRLQPSSGGRGVTALVILPASSVVGGPDRSNVASPLPGSKASREQGPEPFAPGAGVAASADPASIIEATVVPDLRDRPSPFDTPVLDTPSDDAPLADPAPVASELEQPVFDRTTFDRREVESPPTVLGDVGAADPEAELAAYRREQNARAEALAAEIDDSADVVIGATDDVVPDDGVTPDPWTQFSRNVFGDAPDDEAPIDGSPSADAPRDGSGPFDSPLSVESLYAPTPEPGPLDDAVAATPSARVDDLDVVAEVFDPARSEFDDQWWTSPTPPPAPEAIPDQPEWSPLGADAAQSPAPEVNPFQRPAAEPLRSAAAADTADAAAPVSAFSPAPRSGLSSGPNGSSGSNGGLARRVPGASLAESRQPGPSDAPSTAVDRSADGVRSMLSSFQAGRTRGRIAPGDGAADAPSAQGTLAERAHDETTPTDAAPASGDSYDVSQDGRSTR